MHDDHPIPRAMDVEFPPISAGREGGEEPRKGVLAVPARQAAVRDEGGERVLGHIGAAGQRDQDSEGRNSGLNIAARAASAYQTEMPDLIRAGDDAEVDRALIARWNTGDQRAATTLVERHAPSLARFVGSLGVLNAPDEIVQDTFVRAFGSLDSFRGESSLRSWLFTIARRLVLDQRRASRHERNHVAIEDAQDQLVSADDVLDGVVADESEGRVRQAVARLSPTQREVFTLRVVEGLSYKEIAVVASTTEGAARVHYHNAMKAVKEFLDA
jgi:RNA polymerase sigma-70 factor (ECF subfamily)